jgi:hypothetical protein
MRMLQRVAMIGCVLSVTALGAPMLWEDGPAGAGLTVPAQVSASNWTVAPQSGAVAGSASLDSVSCVTSTFCMGGGDQAIGGGNGQFFAETWNGSTWTPVTVPAVPAGTQFSNFLGVSCVSTTMCLLVGGYANASLTEIPSVAEWNGSQLQWITAPGGAATDSYINSISCTSATFCAATGNPYTTNGYTAQWNGSTWTAAIPSPPTGAISFFMRSVSCSAPTLCVAVGSFDNASNVSETLAEVWNGTIWTGSTPENDPVLQNSALNSVSCAGAVCTAAGVAWNGGNPNTDVNLVETLNGSTWSLGTVPRPNNASDLLGVRCFSATACTAVGISNTDAGGTTWTPEVLTWNGQAWVSVSNLPNGGSDRAEYQGVDCIAQWACMTVGNIGFAQPLNVWAPISRTGYRFVASDGGVFNYGSGAPFLGSMGGSALNAPIVGMAVMPAGDGYYLVASDGGIFNFGSAQFFGSMGGKALNKPIVGIAVTADGGGYWLVASDGGIFSFGDAQFFGSTGALTLNKPIVGMAPTPNGLGYYLVASDGGIFNYGNAVFSGSMGGTPLNKPVVGMSVPVAGGYYLVASDGGIFSFPTGASGPPFFGSTGAITLNKPIVSMTTVAGGYYLSGTDGGVFAFPTGSGGLPFYGSTGSIVLNKPIVGIAG